MRILIVDDHEIVRVGLKQLFAHWTVVEAADGDVAVKLFVEQKPDVTLLDVRMPNNGISCLARIKLDHPDAAVLMFSGNDNPTHIARAVALGARGYLSKTATSNEILAAAKAVANGEELWTRELLRQVSGSLSSNGDADVRLTKRESEVLKQLAFGLTNKEIGNALDISYETVKEHVQHILRKVGVSDRTQAAVWAVRKELV